MKFIIYVFALLLLGCATHKQDELKQVDIYKSNGSRQCMSDIRLPLSKSEQALNQKGIEVIGSYSGYLNAIFPRVCGGRTGQVNVHTIKQSDLQKAKELDYKIVSEKMPFKVTYKKLN